MRFVFSLKARNRHQPSGRYCDGFIDDLVEKYRPKYDGTETVQDWTIKTSEFLLQMGRKIDCLEIRMEENELELSDCPIVNFLPPMLMGGLSSTLNHDNHEFIIN